MILVIRYLVVVYFVALAFYSVCSPTPTNLSASERLAETFPFWIGGYSPLLGLLGLPAYMAIYRDIYLRPHLTTLQSLGWMLSILFFWPSVFFYLVTYWWSEARARSIT